MTQYIAHDGHHVNPLVSVALAGQATNSLDYIIDPLELIKLGVPSGVRAAWAIDVLKGHTKFKLSTALLAKAFGVSMSSINRARRLSDEERDAVICRERPLVLSQTARPQQRLSEIVDEIGLDRVQNLLWSLRAGNAG
jgi:hypothetical protein